MELEGFLFIYGETLMWIVNSRKKKIISLLYYFYKYYTLAPPLSFQSV